MNRKLDCLARVRRMVFVFGCAWLSSAALAESHNAFVTLGNGVVVDVQNERLYTMNPKTGIEATNIATGERLWRSVAADRPLSIREGTLLAQSSAEKSGQLELAYLTAESGELLRATRLSVDDSVWARTTDTLDHRFVLQSTGADSLHWQHTTKKIQGARLDRAEPQALRTEGFLRADFSTRSVAHSDTGLRASTIRDFRASVPDGAVGKRALYSADRQHIATHRPLSPQARQSGQRYEWHVYSADGKRLQTFASAVSFSPYIIVGNRLLYVTPARKWRAEERTEINPMSVRAIDLNSGVELFKVPVKDTRYNGPFPP
ncbi:MAG: hypothetical protein AAF465_02425 [Pseudomonadota bacterium]